MKMEAVFEEPELFQARYQRNNKRGGLKNLRCFPTCAAMHRERGFCGRMVTLTIRHPPNARLAIFAEFVPVLDKNTGLKDEDIVTVDKAKEICRDKANPTKPWIEGEIIEQTSTVTKVAFNRDKKGWHYGWASNKHTCNASHALQAYVMEYRDNDKLVVKGVFQSPHFTLFCRRRRRFAMVPSAPIAPPASKKRGSSTGSKKRPMDEDDDDEEGDEDEEGGSEDFDDDDDDDGTERASMANSPTDKPQRKKQRKSASQQDKRGLPPPPPPPLSELNEPPKKKQQVSRRKKVIMESKLVLPSDTSAIAKKATIERVEKMLRELSRRTTARSKPVLLSRPCSPTELFSSTDTASTSTNEDHLGLISGSMTTTPSVSSPLPMKTSETAPAAALMSSSTTKMTQEQFSAHLFECIDFFGGDSLLDDHVFEDDDDAFLDLRRMEEAVQGCIVSPEEKSKLMDDLADYLLDETSFADAIYNLSRVVKSSSYQTQDSAAFDSFIDVISQHLAAFLRSRLMTEEDFDRLFPDEPETPFFSGEQLLSRSAFRQAIMGEDAYTTEASGKPSGAPVTPEDLHRLERMIGSWVLAPGSRCCSPSFSAPVSISTSSSSSPAPLSLDGPLATEYDGMESIRESLGYPWLLRKMLNFMEEKFSVGLEGNVMSVRLQRKLFSSGAMTIVLDNQEHDWGMKLPMFEGISSMWRYHAWVENGKVNHVHDTGGGAGGVSSRTRRIMWVDDDDRLIIDISLEELHANTERWETVAHAMQKAVRC